MKLSVSPTTHPSVSLFSNCGAGDIGYADAGFEFEVMAELDPRRLRVCSLNHPGAVPVRGDLRETWSDVLRWLDDRRQFWTPATVTRGLSLVTACPPCQGMSSARNDLGKADDPDAGSRDARNLLVRVVALVVKETLPEAVVVENVPQFLTRRVRHPDTGEALTAAYLLMRELEEAGYEAYPIVTDLADFGVPQSRRRSFLTFLRRDLAAVEVLRRRGGTPYPRPTHAPDHGGEPISLERALSRMCLPRLDSSSPIEATAEGYGGMHVVPVWSERQRRMVAAISARSGASAWENQACENGCTDVRADPEDVVCPSCRSAPLLRPVIMNENGPRFVKGFRNTSYRRMRADLPASTVTTASGRVGSDVTIHPWEHRVLSARECQSLQTFPSTFKWGNALEAWGVTGVREMIGEAVPPKFTREHGRIL